ncbi:hypothetical protein Vsou_11120 [Vulcanisaeta souniana JCM 11219]|uniref:Uncharacterized protein n=1 Tax=Vulcanisaeta souniana JCM 11219 TaxID=1293586 RepID=A0ABN6SRH1_9CREN|nr:hypothetical protein Vsou_11120 [Vulcanisaeta souniana JCM 11219]
MHDKSMKKYEIYDLINELIKENVFILVINDCSINRLFW